MNENLYNVKFIILNSTT